MDHFFSFNIVGFSSPLLPCRPVDLRRGLIYSENFQHQFSHSLPTPHTFRLHFCNHLPLHCLECLLRPTSSLKNTYFVIALNLCLVSWSLLRLQTYPSISPRGQWIQEATFGIRYRRHIPIQLCAVCKEYTRWQSGPDKGLKQWPLPPLFSLIVGTCVHSNQYMSVPPSISPFFWTDGSACVFTEESVRRHLSLDTIFAFLFPSISIQLLHFLYHQPFSFLMFIFHMLHPAHNNMTRTQFDWCWYTGLPIPDISCWTAT